MHKADHASSALISYFKKKYKKFSDLLATLEDFSVFCRQERGNVCVNYIILASMFSVLIYNCKLDVRSYLLGLCHQEKGQC
jgi:hypothetical protein